MNIQQFFSRYKAARQPNGCVLWTRAANAGGYGQLMFEGRRNQAAHRIAYELAYGPIPPGMLVCHTCDTKRCINPKHLFLGTPLDNNRDRHNKGRDADRRGHKSGTAKLTWALVREIRADQRKDYEIADALGISRANITNIKNNVIWVDPNYVAPKKYVRNKNRGLAHHNAKLSDDDVRAIRKDSRPAKVIAAYYEVTPALIWMIKRRAARNVSD